MNVDRAGDQPIWITSVTEHIDHTVWDHVLGEHISEGRDRFPTLCDDQVVPASLAAPPATRCPTCRAVLAA